MIRSSFIASQGSYGAPRVFLDLRETGETCGKHRVARLMRVNQLRPDPQPPAAAVHGDAAKLGLGHGYPVHSTWQGWLYLAVAMDLFPRKIKKQIQGHQPVQFS